jgi:hypothetical protein
LSVANGHRPLPEFQFVKPRMQGWVPSIGEPISS